MRKLTQFVSFLMVCFVAAQPALAGLPCTVGLRSACAPGCPMAISGMGADCPMAGAMTAGDCQQNCCAQAQQEAMVLPALISKVHAGLIAPASTSPLGTGAANRTDCALRSSVTAVASSPPLYLLHQVFRI